MKRKITLFLCLLISLTIVLTGCPKVDEPDPITPETPSQTNTNTFIRKHTENDAFNGFTEIYFDNYEEQLSKSEYVFIKRKKTNDIAWQEIMFIDVYGSSTPYSETLSNISPVIDYYVEENVDYLYYLEFGKPGVNRYDEDSPEERNKSEKGYGEIQIVQGSASYDEETGILLFSNLPSFSYTPLTGIFDEYGIQKRFSYEGYSILRINFSDIVDSKVTIFDQNIQTFMLGTTLTPGNYDISISKTYENYRVLYEAKFPMSPNMPSITLPSTLPAN